YLEKASNLQPNDVEILLLKANILSLTGNYKDAIEAYESALPLTEDKDEIFYHIGLTYQSLTQFDDAILAYKQAIELNLNNESALYELAYCLDTIGELESSISYYKKFIDADPYS